MPGPFAFVAVPLWLALHGLPLVGGVATEGGQAFRGTPQPWLRNPPAASPSRSARMIVEDELSGATLLAAVDDLMTDQALRAKMAAQSKAIGHPDAADALIKVLKKAQQD